MTSFLVLEKGKSRRPEQDHDGRKELSENGQQYVYMLLPHGKMYRVMRARLDHVLRVAEPVRELSADSPEARDALESDRLLALGRDDVSVRLPSRMLDEAGARSSGTRPQRARFGDIEVDPAARAATRSGELVRLAPLEFDLLIALLKRDGAAVSRADLLREVWSGRDGVTQRTVDTHVFNLRRKLEDDPARPRHILTVSKIGYRLKA